MSHASPARSSVHSRRSSSGYSPSSKRRLSQSGFEGRNSGSGYIGTVGGAGGATGMANLADELGDAWGSDVEDEGDDGFEDVDDGRTGHFSFREEPSDLSLQDGDTNHDSMAGLANGVNDLPTQKNQEAGKNGTWDSASSPDTKTKRRKGRSRGNTAASRPESTIGTIAETNGDSGGANGYDVDDGGEAFSFELDARLAEVRELVEAGEALVGEEGGAIMRRMLGRLQELGSQSGMDGAVTW